MPYFLDANVIIGIYFYNGDKMGQSAINLWIKSEKKHSSLSIWHKCFGSTNNISGRCRTIKYDISSEFQRAGYLLTNGYPPAELLGTMWDEDWRIKEVIGDLVAKYEKNIENLKKIIRRASWDYEKSCDTRFNQLRDKNSLEIHDCTPIIPEIKQKISQFIPDPEDVDVVWDAHYVAIKIQEIVLVTGDRYHIISNRDKITSNTSITAVIPLQSF